MAQGNCRRREAAGREIIKSQKKSAADILSAALSLSKNPRVDKGRQPLMFNPALTTQGELPRRGKRRPPGGCASERMKTQRFSYFADFAARRPAAAGQFRPVSRGGTSCFLREAKHEKNSQKLSLATFAKSERIKVIYQKILTWVPEMVYTKPRSLK